MSLSERAILLLDAQTTGMRPPQGRLLELAWARVSGDDIVRESFLFKLPDGEALPKRISQLTGVTEKDLESAVDEAAVVAALEETVGDKNPVVLIHYASFEKSFLEDLWMRNRGVPFPWTVICTHKLADRLFPNLPSRNIRAVAGSFGHSSGEFKRAGPHVEATLTIWRGLSEELGRREIRDWNRLEDWLKITPKPKREKYDYRVDRLKRLELPDRPGLYRMLGKSGEILYVGKATSLKDRVNSYFRGIKGREARKLEMMAQVWDLDVTVCETPLEAALLESDEIKRLSPPYNVSLKTGNRKLQFYDRDFSESSEGQDEKHPLGPYRPFGSIDSLRLLCSAREDQDFSRPIFYEEIEAETVRTGFLLFLKAHGFQSESLRGMRSFLALGMKFYREALKAGETEVVDEEEVELETDEDQVYTPEDVAEKVEGLLARSAAEIRRSRKLTRLLNARIRWTWSERRRELEFRRGREHGGPTVDLKRPWQGLTIAEYDRVTIVNTELSRTMSEPEILPLV